MTLLDSKALRAAFGSYMTGVTVVTARAEDGSCVGFTANSFTSVSLDPPLLLVCPGNQLSSIDVFRTAGYFAVNILAEGQESVSNIFASSKADRFSQVEWRADENGSPRLDGSAASFGCAAYQCSDAGDHAILIGRVTSFDVSGRPGLGYCSSGYFSLGKERQSDAVAGSGRTAIAGAIIEYGNRVYAERRDGRLFLPTVRPANRTGARSAMAQHLESLGMTADIGAVYSIFDGTDRNEHFTFFRVRARSDKTNGSGEFIPIDDIRDKVWSSSAQTRMMDRFGEEHGNNVFGLYVGDSFSGEVHINETSRRQEA